ncbi:MAG: hypothetical protein LBJ72_03085 [Dysgonamonadaceae bacterium]|jgi:natural product precursor|nr:hypothetical protein [Dysgonamonadaceae bacterium]
MKKLKKIELKNAVVMNASEMKNVIGGISREEYCKIMKDSWDYNVNDWDAGTIEGWWYGWSHHCM